MQEDKENKSCDVCGKHFSYSWFVQRHLKQVHSKETVDFICSKCKKTYKKENAYRAHILTLLAPVSQNGQTHSNNSSAIH